MPIDGHEVTRCIARGWPCFLDKMDLVDNEGDVVESVAPELLETDGISEKDVYWPEFELDFFLLIALPDFGARPSLDSFVVWSNEDCGALFEETSQALSVAFPVKILHRPVIFGEVDSQGPEGVYLTLSWFFLAHLSLLVLMRKAQFI